MTTALLEERVGRRTSAQAVPVRRPRLYRQARAALLWGLASFVLCQVGLRALIDLRLPQLRDPVFETRARPFEERIRQHAQRPATVVMVGSSITGSAFKDELLENTLAGALGQPAVVANFGRPGGGPLTSLVWTRRLLDRGIRPDFLFVEISPFLFNSADKPVDIHLFPASFLEQNDVEVVERYGLDMQLAWQWWQSRIVPSYGHRLTTLSYLAQDLVPVNERVYGAKAGDQHFWLSSKPRSPEELRRIVARKSAEFEPSFKSFAAGSASLAALEELLALLQKEKVPAAMVLMPKGSTLRGLYHSENLGRFLQTLAILGDRYGCPVIDAFTWLADELFADGYHLNTEGADVFTKRLASEYLLPELKDDSWRHR